MTEAVPRVAELSGAEARALIRAGGWRRPTAGMASAVSGMNNASAVAPDPSLSSAISLGSVFTAVFGLRTAPSLR